MKRALIAIGLVLALLFSSGCAGTASEPGNTNSGQVDTGYGNGHVIPNSDYYVKKFTIDGTTCVVIKDGGSGGLSCDWAVPVPTPTASDPYYPTESPTP